MRISHHHDTTLAYCRELQVPVQAFVPDSESAYLYQTRSSTLSGRRIRLREARADFDGYIAELLSKALSQTQLDHPLTAEDRDRLLAYLRRLGALDQQRQYRGSPRRGADDQGRPSAPLALGDLLGANLDFYAQTDWYSQPTMVQVAGGMDRLPAALAALLENRIVYRAAVREIRQSEREVWETAFSVSWPRVPWSRGSWRSESAAAHKALAVLHQPDGRVHFAGDYMTDMSSWMQGANRRAKPRRRFTGVRSRAAD